MDRAEMTEQAKQMLQEARATGNKLLEHHLLHSHEARLPSVEEINTKFPCEHKKQ